MLAGVRLHQTVSVLPVQHPLDLRTDRQPVTGDLMRYLILALDGGDLAPVQRTAVPLLASASGIESGPVQNDPVPLRLGHGGGELSEVGVGLVKLDGHDRWMGYFL